MHPRSLLPGLLVVLSMALSFGCPSNPPPLPPPDDLDAGTSPGVDAGSDAGTSPNPDLQCDLGTQSCDGGSCLLRALEDGGYGSACFAGACDLVAQNCPTSEKCTYVSVDGGPTFARGCSPEGTAAEGQPCTGTPSSNTCMRGLMCALLADPDGGASSRCVKLCNTNADCTTPQLCFVVLTIQGTEERPLACGDPPPSCDPLAQDCTQPSEACYPGTPEGRCYPAGSKLEGDACVYTNECAKGLACIGDKSPGTCRPLCRHPSGDPACAAGTCKQLKGQAELGVCM